MNQTMTTNIQGQTLQPQIMRESVKAFATKGQEPTRFLSRGPHQLSSNNSTLITAGHGSRPPRPEERPWTAQATNLKQRNLKSLNSTNPKSFAYLMNKQNQVVKSPRSVGVMINQKSESFFIGHPANKAKHPDFQQEGVSESFYIKQT